MRRRAVAVHAGRVGQEQHRVALGAQRHALVLAGQEAGAPEAVVERLGLLAAGPGRSHHDEGGQVLVLGAQAVAEPGAEAGPAGELMAGADVGDGRVVVDRLGLDGLDDGDVVDDLRRSTAAIR